MAASWAYSPILPGRGDIGNSREKDGVVLAVQVVLQLTIPCQMEDMEPAAGDSVADADVEIAPPRA